MTPEQQHELRDNMVAKAASHLGEREIGFTNTGPEVDLFLAYVGDPPGNPWCMAFAIFCAGNVAAEMGLALADTNLIRTGYCPAQADHARANGELLAADDVAAGRVSILPGDLMLEWIASEGDYHHTGIVEVAPNAASGIFGTIEGNTNTDGGADGYEVARQRRCVADKAADGHAKYAFVRTC